MNQIWKKRCVDDIKTIGDVISPTCRKEKFVHVSNNKMNSFYHCKKYKACCHVLNIAFRDQKPTIKLFGGNGTHCLHESRLRKKTSPFLKKILRQSQPSTSECEPKKVKMSQSKYGKNVSVSYWLMT